MKAIVLNGTTATVVNDRALPALREGYLLIKTIAVALNPTDAKALAAGRGAENGLSGWDVAGIIEEVGPKVIRPWRKGDRVFGIAFGSNKKNAEDGAFAEIIVAKGDLCMRIPDGMSFEDATSLSLSALTCGQGLFQKMKLNLPDNPIREKKYILIYGGSSAAGTLGIQYAKLAGYSVLTTCSLTNAELVKSRGAEAVFDYKDPTCAQKVIEYTQGDLQLVWDTIGSDQGVEICMAVLSTKPGSRYGTILFNSIPRKDVVFTNSALMTAFGVSFDLGGKHWPVMVEDVEFTKMFAGLTERLVAEGKLKPHPVEAGEGGFHGVLEGLKLIRDGKVSGVKLVYRVAE